MNKDIPLFQNKPYQKYSPNVFDDSLSLYEQIITLIEFLNQVIDNSNEVTEEILLIRKQFEDFKDDIENRVLPENLEIILNQWIETGKIDTVLIEKIEDVKQDFTAQLAHIATISAERMIELENGNVTKGIQRTINEAMSLNKARVLWSGVYEIDSTLVIDRLNSDNNTQIVFFGGGQLKKAAKFTGDRLIQIKIGFHDEDNIVFNNISFDGVDYLINGIDTFKENIHYTKDGATLSDGHQTKFIKFNDCTFHRFYRAVRLSSLSYTFNACLFQDNRYGAFLSLAANNNTFVGCQFRRNKVGAHVKQVSPSTGTVNNVFLNCNFESNSNNGLIIENATYTSLFGGYFENNSHQVDTYYLYSPKRSEIYFKGGGSAGNTILHGVFFWKTQSEYEIVGDQINKLNILSCGNPKIYANIITDLTGDVGIGNFEATSTIYDSQLVLNGFQYTIRKGIKYETKQYTPIYNDKAMVNRMVPLNTTLYSIPSLSVGAIKIHTGTSLKLSIKLHLSGMTGGGNQNSEGYIEKNFLVNIRKSPKTKHYYASPMGSTLRGYANSVTTAGQEISTNNIITATSDIILTKLDDLGNFSVAITDLINNTMVNWGQASNLYVQGVVEVEGVTSLEPYVAQMYPTDIVTFS